MAERASRTRPATFRIGASRDVDIDEPSDVTALPGGLFLAVSDLGRTAAIVGPGGRAEHVLLAGEDTSGESGFEAVSFDPLSGRLFVVSEERHELEIYRLRGEAFGEASLLARSALPAVGAGKKKRKKKDRNKGVEGMAWLSAALSPTGHAQLIVAKEARPSALFLLDADGGGSPREIVLDERIVDACHDFSGLAVDPTSGRLFLCSDESASFAELALLDDGGDLRVDLVGATELRDPRGRPLERVEGIALDERGDLHVLLENDRQLWHFERVSSS